MSSTLPDFTPHGYKAVKELGRNTAVSDNLPRS
jgi:hypothetical protein